MATEACVVLTTVSGEPTMRAIVDRLLSDKLAACIQVLPIRSFYTWQGAREEAVEQLLLIKARRADYAAIAEVIAGAHDYDVPEILCLDASAVAPSYLGWLLEATDRSPSGPLA